MKRIICSSASILLAAFLLTPTWAADDTELIQKQENYTVSLELKFSKRSQRQNPLERIASLLDWGPNGYASGFVVGDGLVMTSYHVVSGELSAAKRAVLGFAPGDKLKVDVHVSGCQASVLKVDVDADLALLRVCQSQKQRRVPVFQESLNKDEQLFLIARPHGFKIVKKGIFDGPYMSRGQQYWSAKIEARDGFSGSPVYNDKAEIIGVISDYIWEKKLAVISPGARAQKLLEDYKSKP